MNKHFKKILAGALSAIMLFSALSALAVGDSDVVASGYCGGEGDGTNLTWTLCSNGTLTISGAGKMKNYNGTSDFNGTTYTSTAPWFEYVDDLKNLVLGDDITDIGNYAFMGCINLTGELVIPDSVTDIGYYAFMGCINLTGELVIPDGVTRINDNAFRFCSGLTGDLVIPDGVTKIGSGVFMGCSGLTGDLLIPFGVTMIESSVFDGCSGLTNITIPDSVTRIDGYAFRYCSGLRSVTLPSSVITIAEQAFRGCSNLTNITLPDGLHILGAYSFAETGLTPSVTVPGSVTNFTSSSAFQRCYGLKDVYVQCPEHKFDASYLLGGTRVHWQYDLSECTASISGSYSCTGEAIVPSEDDITVISPNGRTLYYGTDYIIDSASNNVNAGTATVRIVPPEDGISIQSQDVTFNIVSADLSGAKVTFPDNISYQGEPCCPDVTVVLNGITLTKDTDYTVSYSNNNGVGTGTAIITGIGNYIGSIIATFEIEVWNPSGINRQVNIQDDIVEATINGTFIYNGAEHVPKPILVYHFTNQTTGVMLDYNMTEGTDYEIISYENNVNAGTAQITIKGLGTFENERNIDFNISPCELSSTSIADIPSAEYCKKDICPNPEIKIGNRVMIKDVDYELSYENNRNAGTATVTITGKGNLRGTVTKNFTITPRDGSMFTYYIILP